MHHNIVLGVPVDQNIAGRSMLTQNLLKAVPASGDLRVFFLKQLYLPMDL